MYYVHLPLFFTGHGCICASRQGLTKRGSQEKEMNDIAGQAKLTLRQFVHLLLSLMEDVLQAEAIRKGHM